MSIGNKRLRQRRDDIFEQLILMLRDDHRVTSVWLSGSEGRGTDDDWSDIDLHIAVQDDHVAHLLAERMNIYTAVGNPILIQDEMVFADRVYQLVMFPGPVMLDFVVHPVAKAVLDFDSRVIFDRTELPRVHPEVLSPEETREFLQERLNFFWLMVPIALKYIARQRTQRAVTQYDLISGAFVSVWRVLHDPDRRDASGSHWLHPEHDRDLIALLPRMESEISPSTMFVSVT